MSAYIISAKENETQILITIRHGQSLPAFKEQLQHELHYAKKLVIKQQLERLYEEKSKKQQPKTCRSLWVSSAGRAIRVPK
ncbi:MAG: hypothetical protein PUP46_00765 [Endozoicomonas sp. (ex Botrylloides leachii)]|nr:hypothetical protein [Endozoicomonas sp. (ex Botrylloides leachii)]